MIETATVFIVDDDEAVRDSMGWLMQSVGLHVETYDSAHAFMEHYSVERPGCLVLDIRMPGMSGLDLQQKLIDEDIQVPVIIISGHGDVPIAVRAMKAGAVDFIEKPFNDQVLLDAVQRAISVDEQLRGTAAQQADIRERIGLLTPRETEVLHMVVDGMSNKLIAAALDVSQKTVEAHRAKVMEKLQAKSLSQLVRMTMSILEKKED